MPAATRAERSHPGEAAKAIIAEPWTVPPEIRARRLGKDGEGP